MGPGSCCVSNSETGVDVCGRMSNSETGITWEQELTTNSETGLKEKETRHRKHCCTTTAETSTNSETGITREREELSSHHGDNPRERCLRRVVSLSHPEYTTVMHLSPWDIHHCYTP